MCKNVHRTTFPAALLVLQLRLCQKSFAVHSADVGPRAREEVQASSSTIAEQRVQATNSSALRSRCSYSSSWTRDALVITQVDLFLLSGLQTKSQNRRHRLGQERTVVTDEPTAVGHTQPYLPRRGPAPYHGHTPCRTTLLLDTVFFS